MYNQKNQQSYSTYFKAAFATVFAVGSLLVAKSTGYLFENPFADKENNIDKNIDLRRSEETSDQIINQETPQSLQLINSTAAGKFNIPNLQDMIIKNNTAYVAAGVDGFKVFDITNINNFIELGKYQLSNGFAHQLNIQGNYAYIAYDITGLRIIDITNPRNLSLAGVYMMGTTNPPITKVAIAGNTAFVVDENTGRFEFVDVNRPTQIFRVYLNIPGENAYRIKVINSIVYVVGYSIGLQLVNVSDPSAPALLSGILLDSSQSLDVVDSIAYVGGATPNSLQLINITNPKNLSLLSSLNASWSAYDVSADISTAYVIDGSSSLYLINISNPSNLSLLSDFMLNKPRGICIAGTIAYAVNNFNLQLINVSNPINLSLLSTFPLYLPSDVEIVNNIAYVPNEYGLDLINVTNPSTPSLLSSFTSMFISRVSIAGSVAGITVISGDLLLINVSNSSNLTLIGEVSGTTYDINVVGNIAYMADWLIGLQIIDVSRGCSNTFFGVDILKKKFINDLFSIERTFFYTEQDEGLLLVDNRNFSGGVISMQSQPYSVSVIQNIAYLPDLFSGLQLINVSNPNTPSFLSNFPGSFYGVTVVGSTAYVVGYLSGLQLINVSNPNNLNLLSSFNISFVGSGSVCVVGEIAYTVNTAGLQLINISDSSNPNLLGSFSASYVPQNINVVSGIAYVADFFSGLKLINVSNPSNPNLLASFTTIGSPTYISVVDNTAVLSINVGMPGSNPILFIDVSDPNNPTLMGKSTTLESPVDSSIVDSVVYVIDLNVGFGVMNISDPTYPQLVRKYNLEQTTRISVSSEFAYVLLRGFPSKLKIINLASENSSFSTNPWTAAQVTALNNTAYLSDTGKNLYLLDITNTSNPIEISRYLLSSQATDMIVAELQDGNNNYIYLYVAESLNGIEVVDVTNSSFPVYAGSITANITNARTLQIEGTTLYVNNNNAEILAFDMTVLHYLNVTTNKINLIQGTTIITNSFLNVIAVNPFNRASNDVDAIVYTINNLQQGQFIFNNVAVNSFTQAQINNNQIQFFYTGNGTNPSFDFRLNNNNIVAGPFIANINLIRQPQIIANKLICNEDQTVAVTSSDISAIDIDGSSNPNLIFIVTEIGNSQFEYVSKPGVIVLQFSQQDVIDKKVQFTQIDSGIDNIASVNDIKPFYQLTVTNGQNQSSINTATIDFDATPRLINNTLSINNGETLIIKNENLAAIDFDSNNAMLLFKLSNVMHGNFTSSINGAVTNFTQQDITRGSISFIHDGSGFAPSYTVSVTDGRASSANQTATVSFNQGGQQIPVLLNDKLVINQGEVVLITSKEISATSTTSDPAQLNFVVSQVSNGRFQLINNPSVSITEFLQAQITNNTVQFAHLGGGYDKPAFMISVVDGLLATPPVAGEIDFDAAPQLTNNKLIITNGNTVLLTSDYLQAIDIDSNNATLTFTVSDINHGQFKVANTLAATTFIQQQISDGSVSFIHDGSGTSPSYAVSVSDGRITTTSQSATILFTNAAARQMPVLKNHQFMINQDQTITLTLNMLSASSVSVDSSTLLFIVDEIGNGRFQLATKPGIFITQFTQDKIAQGSVEFVHIGGETDKPIYQVSVSDGVLSTTFTNGIINFNAAPEIINNTLTISNGESIFINSNILKSIDIDSNNSILLFKIYDLAHGNFSVLKNNTWINADNFIQQDITNGLVKFTHDGSNIAPSYTVSVTDNLGASSTNQTATVLFNNANSQSNTPAIVGAVVGGVLGLGVLLAAGGLFAKKQIDQSTRNKHRLAAYIWENLKLQGIDNFGTDLGKKYVSMIENNLIPELKQHGYDTDTMEDRDLRELAKNIATVAKNKITHNTTFFGSSLITVDDLQRNVSNLVQGLLEENISSDTADNYHLLEDDDASIPLKPFRPSFNLSANKYENV